MSHSSKIFEEAPIKVQNKNGFDLSHLHSGTALAGQLLPVMCKLLPPNSDFTLGVAMQVELPPLATAFFGRIDAIVEGFVCPCSILYGGWKKFISNNPATMNQSGTSFALPVWDPVKYYHDYLVSQDDPDEPWPTDYDMGKDILENASILDSLGFRVYNDSSFWTASVAGGDVESKSISLLPFLAYHMIWRTFYRNTQVTADPFHINDNPTESPYSTGSTFKNVGYIWHSYYTAAGNANVFRPYFDDDSTYYNPLIFDDGVAIWQTRQRNYSRDYFTAASTYPQQGANGASLSFDVVSNEGEFTISSLRAANALQKFLETNNLSQDYSDMMRNRWGTRPIDADFDEPYYLGRVIVPVYQKSVYQQDNSATATAQNPFARQGATGTRAASGSFTGEGSICKKFHNSTWAYVMCIFSLVPHANYAQGINRELFMTELGDFPAPELQTIGYEDIWGEELWYYGDTTPGDSETTFGYIPRYSRFKYMDDSISGELRAGRTLDSFVLQRDITGTTPTLSTSFLEIPITALDDVFSVSTADMHLSCWFEIFFEFKVAMPLADFCIPTLGELQDTHTIKTSIGGSKL